MSKFIVGADECGYGSYMGPLVICALKAELNWSIQGLNDSKKLSPIKRSKLSEQLHQQKSDGIIDFKIFEASNTEIDNKGLGNCLKELYYQAYSYFIEGKTDIEMVIDGNLKLNNIKSIIKGDTLIPTIMAASIVGKVYRDSEIIKLDLLYPEFNWKGNKGYGTKEHSEAIKKYGLTPLHRKSYDI